MAVKHFTMGPEDVAQAVRLWAESQGVPPGARIMMTDVMVREATPGEWEATRIRVTAAWIEAPGPSSPSPGTGG
jgi:hypothetical protein